MKTLINTIAALLLISTDLLAAPQNPIMFVGQVPPTRSFGSIAATFGNHLPSLTAAPRGGGLFIRYPDGSVKDITKLAGFGSSTSLQDAKAIAVRDPAIHWDGKKAVFSMIIGAPSKRYETNSSYRWQIYEVTGLGKSETPVITKLANQPLDRNNIYPTYDSKSRVIYVSDQVPVKNAAHLYPPLDEYELNPINSGIWRDGVLLNHAPSGDFKPFVDSFGRIIFSQWDHLQRDQQADADAMGKGPYGTFNYSNESATAQIIPRQEEVFPEPRAARTDLLAGTPLIGHNFNHFFPWEMNQDGTGSETLNHIGRQEFGGSYMRANRNDDPVITDDYGQYTRFNKNRIHNIMQISESPLSAGTYFGVNAPEFGTFGAGQIIRFNGGPKVNADAMAITYITHKDTSYATQTPKTTHSGLYRDPILLADGTLVATHTPQTANDFQLPRYSYDFRIKTLKTVDGYAVPDAPLTQGIYRDISWWSPDEMLSFKGNLWEMYPVEIKARPVPPITGEETLPSPEQTAFNTTMVDLQNFRAYLKANNLALIVSRNVTMRDNNDKSQPFNLQVPSGAKTAVSGQKVYSVSHLRVFQANYLRGWTGGYSSTPRPGRRVIATPMDNSVAVANNPSNPLGKGFTQVGLDGSMAMIVPAKRALSWQLSDATGNGVVRERYWVTFQPGEIRVCASCHGINTKNQVGSTLTPTNTPQALINLLQWWKANKAPL